ncbi:Branched-chain amino acid ABC transporter, permease protein [uncultured Eubacteriales bacterium]|uniref:Branched-chain amino acid ABC transporter, permease protein n=1 Tax=uncultured Eubacteriales bacterium TaxID=172733 RepID=A0A212KGH2_9FIRM|nr:Branched-chain amino acid ABC transporter, permease protein [uncultured Eubacteriales bacterium]
MNEVLSLVFSVPFGFSVLRLTTPILLAALASVISERAGVGNITMEGTMLLSAFTGVVISAYTGSAWLGFLTGVVIGGLTGYLLSYIIFKLQVNDILAGIAINLLGSGGTVFLLFALTGVRGISTALSSKVMPAVDLPLIKDIPVVGGILSGHNIITYMAFATVFIIWFLLFKTALGLRIRSVGENPDAAKSVGVNVYKTKSIALTIAGVLSGMGGVYMSMGYVSWFAKDLTAGRGWIGIAAAAMSGQHPVIAMVASIFFGVADAAANTLQTINLPSQLVLMIPYVVTLLAMCIYAYYKLQKKGKSLKGNA